MFYSSRYLAKALGINLAKWKRWTREFLPPDPLGGRQSGYARQFNLEQAFSVLFCGRLLTGLKFTIPQARQILADLSNWLTEKRFFDLQPSIDAGTLQMDSTISKGHYTVHICPVDANIVDMDHQRQFAYIIRRLVKADPAPVGTEAIIRYEYQECRLACPDAGMPDVNQNLSRSLDISELYLQFIQDIGYVPRNGNRRR